MAGNVGEAQTVVARYGRERYGARQIIARHRHRDFYAAVVLAGRYEEAGSEGRIEVSAGDVLVHSPFDAHLDRMSARGADILNVALSFPVLAAAVPFGRINDPDELVRCQEEDRESCAGLLLARLRPLRGRCADWPDVLHAQLSQQSARSLGAFAGEHGLRRETVSRRFAKLFGVSPAGYRAEARARRAWRRVIGEKTALAQIAYEEGFADQSHMARAVKLLTGVPPGFWRRSNPFKTGAATAP
ncbi:MAG TPA: AraC family transcriptional regulator [Rhizomicrobium sp.]|nr:AraC family transcriptional regulator [Rhizomicrobium sp.]